MRRFSRVFALLGLALLASMGWQSVAQAKPCPGDFPIYGLIGDAYTKQFGGSDGPMGCPVAAQKAHPEGPGAVQYFEHGQIVWSPNTGPNSLQAAWLEAQTLHISWGVTDPFGYDRFLVRWDRDGVNQGQMDAGGSRNNGRRDIKLTSAGVYRVVIEGCDGDHGSTCRQGWSEPVYVVVPPQAFTSKICNVEVSGLFAAAWNANPKHYGCPVGPERNNPEGTGRVQNFEHGQMVTSPSTGTDSGVYAYVDGDTIYVDGGPTDPYGYGHFLIRFDKDGVNLFQEDLMQPDPDSKYLAYKRAGLTPGRYRIVFEGCDHSWGPSTCRQGWSDPLYIDVKAAVGSLNAGGVTLHDAGGSAGPSGSVAVHNAEEQAPRPVGTQSPTTVRRPLPH